MDTSKTSMTDSKIVKSKTGRVTLSFYQDSNCSDDELDLILSLLGAYNSHGRKFEINNFNKLQEKFNQIIEQADDIKLLGCSGYDDHGWTNKDAQAEADYHNITTRTEMDAYFKKGDK
jgi:hypothetical protein